MTLSLARAMGDRATEPREVAPPPSPRKNWTREAIAHWLVERLSEPVTTLVGIDHGFSFPLKYYEKYDLAHDWPCSWTIFKNIGQQMRPVPTSISFVKASAETVRPAVVILAGDGSRKCARARNPCFISTCPAPSPNPPTLAFLGCSFFERMPEAASISGRSMAGCCRRANQRSSRFIRPYGAIASHVMAAIPISKTPAPLRNGFAGATWTALSNGSSAPA